jgi:hypothetical protein
LRFIHEKSTKDTAEFEKFYKDYGMFLKEGIVTTNEQLEKASHVYPHVVWYLLVFFMLRESGIVIIHIVVFWLMTSCGIVVTPMAWHSVAPVLWAMWEWELLCHKMMMPMK